jgi:hypothetical protein
MGNVYGKRFAAMFADGGRHRGLTPSRRAGHLVRLPALCGQWSIVIVMPQQGHQRRDRFARVKPASEPMNTPADATNPASRSTVSSLHQSWEAAICSPFDHQPGDLMVSGKADSCKPVSANKEHAR